MTPTQGILHSGTNIGSEFLCFFGKPVFCEIATQQRHVCASQDLSERVMHFSARMLCVMEVRGRSDT
jgi:hypothetical protein